MIEKNAPAYPADKQEIHCTKKDKSVNVLIFFNGGAADHLLVSCFFFKFLSHVTRRAVSEISIYVCVVDTKQI